MGNLGSYEKIDYSLRPNKNVERKALFRALARLTAYGCDWSEYEYLGMGSMWFGDFVLAHRALGIDKLTSVEIKPTGAARAEFNRPLACISIKNSSIADELRTRTWKDSNVLAWLDYDGIADDEVRQDISTVCSLANSMDVFLLTVNVSLKAYGADADERTDALMETFGDFLERGEAEKPKSSKSFAQLLGRCLWNAVDESCRQVGRADTVVPLFWVEYQDGALMCTIGWTFWDPASTDDLRSDVASWSSHLGGVDGPQRIAVPVLTKREKLALDRLCPATSPQDVMAEFTFLREREIREYAKWYKDYPFFGEFDV